MKKIFFSIIALATIVACSKSEVAYEASAEIALAPVVKNVTKGAMEPGQLDENLTLGVWADWTHDITEGYFQNASFAYDGNVKAWTASNTSCPWPINGTLSFAGYTRFENDAKVVSYSDGKFTFEDYTQARGFDLCWFNTGEGINNRNSGDPVDVTLTHALSWLTFEVKGGAGTEGWIITSIELNDIANQGTGECDENGEAAWTCVTYNTDMPLLSNNLELTGEFQDIEGGAKNIVVIPQPINPGGSQSEARTQHTLTINYRTIHKNSAGDVILTEDVSKSINLDISKELTENKWEPGIHYTYELTFSPKEILVSTELDKWGRNDGNNEIEEEGSEEDKFTGTTGEVNKSDGVN